jgi:hypothetical protein
MKRASCHTLRHSFATHLLARLNEALGCAHFGGGWRRRGSRPCERATLASELILHLAGCAQTKGASTGSGILLDVSPTVLRVRGFRFYFFSREERRAHVHVQHADGEAKFWIEPAVELDSNYGLKPKQIAEAEKLVEEHLNEIRRAWAKHFPS